MQLKEAQTRFGWLEYELMGIDRWWDAWEIGRWLREQTSAWRIPFMRVEDSLGDCFYDDHWLGGWRGGRVVLHFHYAMGTVLYATGRRSSRALRELRPRLEALPVEQFVKP